MMFTSPVTIAAQQQSHSGRGPSCCMRQCSAVGCTPLVVTYFTENQNIGDCGEAGDRLLLSKIVGCYIPCSITLIWVHKLYLL